MTTPAADGDQSRRTLEARCGHPRQWAGIRRLVYTEGPEAGVEVLEFHTGAGLSFDVHPQRGFDIGAARLFGASLAWLAPTGVPNPAHFSEPGTGWLRTAAGGLLMTCGWRQVGAPCEDAGESLGIHGRAHHTPASDIALEHRWQGDTYLMVASGVLREAAFFGENLEIRRVVTAVGGSNAIVIEDTVTNLAFRREPYMHLYHFNFGWPLISEQVALRFPSAHVEPREASTPVYGYDTWSTPDPVYTERVYYHRDLSTSREGDRVWAEATIEQPEFPLGPKDTRPVRLRLRWTADTLPQLVQWKMAGAGMHVLGIEPGNCRVGGRATERAAGRLSFLEPGQSVSHRLEMTVE